MVTTQGAARYLPSGSTLPRWAQAPGKHAGTEGNIGLQSGGQGGGITQKGLRQTPHPRVGSICK